MSIRASLPRSLPPLLGREGELDQLRAALGQTRLLTLTGPGGVGKTRLAQQLACDVRAVYTDGVWWADLAPLAEPRPSPITSAPPLERLTLQTDRRSIDCRILWATGRSCLRWITASMSSKRSRISANRSCRHAQTCRFWPLAAKPSVSPMRAYGLCHPSLCRRCLQIRRSLSLDAYGAVQLFVYRAESIEPALRAYMTRIALRWRESVAAWMACRWRSSWPQATSIPCRWSNSMRSWRGQTISLSMACARRTPAIIAWRRPSSGATTG